MDYKKVKAEHEAITRKVMSFNEVTHNIYETVALLSKRADQISLEMKAELQNKIEEFSTSTDNLEEVFENREQIEIAKFYERLPKPTLICIKEFQDERVYYRNPHHELTEKK